MELMALVSSLSFHIIGENQGKNKIIFIDRNVRTKKINVYLFDKDSPFFLI